MKKQSNILKHRKSKHEQVCLPWEAVVQLSNDFFNGELHPKEKTLERIGFLGDTDLESIVMQYAHGECHTWTIALHTACYRTQVHYVMADDEIIHSFISSKDGSLAMDSNGVHLFDDVVKHWEWIVGTTCTIEHMRDQRDTLEEIVNPDSEELRDAYESIQIWYEKTELYFKSKTD